ncbi:DUF4238 domain-containing protein [Pedobacter sp. ASV28]|uniref:DUF4238 domain-containing protein n=1 Tax=Pedobacter sp. ASV28 TaxID=2795123 RepID=UPI0018EA977B|nr:DUF4238 domain-containing protein [Pedobacter sp. ASV28]
MKQHFLPEVYLKEFRNKEGKLHCLDCSLLKFDRKVFDQPKYPAEVCRSKDFYTLKPSFKAKNPDIFDLSPLHIEKSFHAYESEYPKLITKIKSRQKALLIKDAHLLIYVLLDLKIRNNYYREKVVSKALKDILEYDLSELKKQIDLDSEGRFPDDAKEQFEKCSEKVKRDYIEYPEQHAESHLSSIAMARSRNDEMHVKISQHLQHFQWKVYISDHRFIITDNPGFSLDYNNVIHNTKFDKEVVVFFPLTPSMCLCVNTLKIDKRFEEINTQKVTTYERATDKLIDFINDNHNLYFSRYVFSDNANLINEVAFCINKKHFG